MRFRAVLIAISNIFPVCSLIVRNHLKIDTMGNFGHFIPRCDSLVPESSTSSTTCWSSCGVMPGEARCSGQGENWQRSFILRARPLKETAKGAQGCSQLERRFLCSLLSSKNKECSPELAKKLKPGEQCYTKCGEPQCPEGDFQEPDAAEDFKYMDCEGGAYRMRCAIIQHAKAIEFNPAAVPMVVPVE